MNRDQKAAVVEEIAGQIQSAQAIFAVDYRGISVEQAADLRGRLRDSATSFRVVKNSLTERAADQAGADTLKPLLVGPTALALVHGDAALAAKALNDAARAFNLLDFKGGLMDGAALSADEVRAIARLPAREVLNAQLVGTIAAPISGLVRTLNQLIAGLAIQLQSIADQGLVSGEAPAEAEAAPEPEATAPVEPPADEPAAPEVEAAPAGAEALPAEEEATTPIEPGEPEATAPVAEPEQTQEPEADAADADSSEA